MPKQEYRIPCPAKPIRGSFSRPPVFQGCSDHHQFHQPSKQRRKPRIGRLCFALSRGFLVATIALLGIVPEIAEARCGCPSGGIPLIQSTQMQGNDLAEISGACAAPHGKVQVFARQRFFASRSALETPRQEIRTKCINNCTWLQLGEVVADAQGRFSFLAMDTTFSTQLVTARRGEGGEYGLLTDLRVRTEDAATGKWSQFTTPPTLGAFRLWWAKKEGRSAFLETRVHGARWMYASIADGPDDGNGLSTDIDVDQDTPNFWLAQNRENPVVAYAKDTSCRGANASSCNLGWLIQQAPAIYVSAPLMGRSSEFPFVLGITTAWKPGAVLLATHRSQDRDMADILVDVDVDVSIDFDFGLDFLGLF